MTCEEGRRGNLDPGTICPLARDAEPFTASLGVTKGLNAAGRKGAAVYTSTNDLR